LRCRTLGRRQRNLVQKWLESTLDPEIQHLTIGERESISRPSLDQYVKELQGFSRHAGVAAVTEIPSRQVETQLLDYMQSMLLRGVHASRGMKLLAAILLVRPEMGKGASPGLARAWRSLKGWQKVTPSRSRMPAPFPTWCGVIDGLVDAKRTDMAMFTLMSVDTYARPGQMMALTPDMIFPPSEASQFWTICLNPEVLGIPSKTGEFDVTVALDAPHYEHLVPVLRALRALPLGRPVWRFTYPEYNSKFHTACTRVGIRLVPYQARHSGASIDATLKRRPLAEIQRRGSWKTTKSVHRYEKGGRLSQVWHAYTPEQRATFLRCEENLIRALVHGQVA